MCDVAKRLDRGGYKRGKVEGSLNEKREFIIRNVLRLDDSKVYYIILFGR